jgi:tetratricopeptide (TPR) repeat protein
MHPNQPTAVASTASPWACARAASAVFAAVLCLTSAHAAEVPGAWTPQPEQAERAAPTAVPLEEVLGESDADPLDGVARQIEAEEYRESIDWLENHMARIEADSHRFDPRLVRPLTLLGDAKAGQGMHGEALRHYRRALHLNRVNAGLNSPEQVEIVYREAEALKALGHYQDANDREEYAFHVLNRAHEPLDEELLPGLYHLAGWYERTSNVFAARALYERAVEIIDHHDKLDTVEAIPALRGIATSYRLERFPPFYMADLEQQGSSVVASEMRRPVTVNNFPAGEAALQRVIRILREEQPTESLARAKAVLDLADWYTLFDKSNRAEPLYAHAWQLLGEIENLDVASYFAEPELLYFPAPGNPSPPPVEKRGERTTGYVEVAFDVTDDGYVRDLDTVASEPDGLMDFRVRKSLRLARYRPMLIDGVPVFKASYTYRHEFPYYPERESTGGEVTTAAAPGR